MIINQKRITSVKHHLPEGLKDQPIYLSVPLNELPGGLLQKIGFENDVEGQTIVPAPQFKRVTFFNSEGGYRKRRDLPMETVYREREWTWKDWADNEHSKTVYVPYQRYRREPIAAPEAILTITSTAAGEKLLVSESLLYQASNEDRIKHIINLFLEIFGFCQVRNARLDQLIPAPTVRLNWKLLPKGTICWPALQEQLEPALRRIVRSNAQPVVITRLEKLHALNPDFVAVGTGGFFGYVIFGFENRSRFVLESVYTGNAIYIFGRNWQELSQLTKAEILSEGLHLARIIHQEGYWKQVLEQVA